jgi:hypothetical protein
MRPRSAIRPTAAVLPVPGQIRMLEKHDVVIGARLGDSVPHALQGMLLIVGVEHDLEHPYIVGCSDLGVGQGGGELLSCLEVSRGPVVQQQHFDLVVR